MFNASAFWTKSVTPVPSKNGFFGDSRTILREGGAMGFLGDPTLLATRWVTRVEKN